MKYTEQNVNPLGKDFEFGYRNTLLWDGMPLGRATTGAHSRFILL